MYPPTDFQAFLASQGLIFSKVGMANVFLTIKSGLMVKENV